MNISHTLTHSYIQMRRPWGQEAELVWQLPWQVLWVFAPIFIEKTQHPLREAHKNNPKPIIITHLCCELFSFS